MLPFREHLVPEAALEALADQNIPFAVKGKTTYEQQMAAIRVLLPLQFNDGREVPPEWLAMRVGSRRSLGAASYETQRSRVIGVTVAFSIAMI